MALTDAQLKQVASSLFLLQPAANTRLTKPVNSVIGSLASKLDPIGSDSRFSDWGIGVVDFSKSVSSPSIWLHNGDDSWRIGSTGKTAILLAAAQLRDDVRAVQDTKLLSKPEDYDDLFALPKLWAMAPDRTVREIAGKDTRRGSRPSSTSRRRRRSISLDPSRAHRTSPTSSTDWR